MQQAISLAMEQAAGNSGAAATILGQVLRQLPSQGDSARLQGAIHNQLGSLAHREGDLNRAADHYAQATQHDDSNAAAWANLGAAQAQVGDMRAAVDSARKALRLEPSLGPAYKVLGSALAALGDGAGAREALSQAVAMAPDPDAHYQLGVALDEAGEWDNALVQHEAALALNPAFGPALSETLFLRRRLCQWQDSDALLARFEQALTNGQRGLKPFSYLALRDDPQRQQICARLWARQVSERAGAAPSPRATAGRRRPLVVGYLSSGFHQHPTACLTAEYFEQHDRERVRPVAFSVGPDDGSALRQRIAASMDQFHDLAGASFQAIERCIVDAGVDILVDLRGYGGGAVSEVLARRPAPVQVNWLAYPGTMGADFIDYIVLDRFVATPEVLATIDETPVILPHSYQPNDTTRDFAAREVSRVDCGLPDDATVLCSFNNSYKISPQIFARWMAVLKAVPDAVLWLLAGKAGTSTDDNLRIEAANAGIDPARLVLMPKLPHLDYLARYALADLFLDTTPYNAHTTASDALWGGCPVLTVAGRSFAARVAGSLLTSASLEDLIVDDLDAYQQLAIELAGDRGALQRLRTRLQNARSEAPLFDSAAILPRHGKGFRDHGERGTRACGSRAR